MRLFRVWTDGNLVADIKADSLEEASEIAKKAYPDKTVRVERWQQQS
jgi:hypothetical protein